LPITNYTPGFKGHIDYIWYTANSLSVTGLLGEVDPAYLGKVVGFPNAHFPSDHIYMLSEFKIKPQVESDRDSGRNERPHFRPPGQPNR
jgi:CCR4-NOT transcription complex subunit 6